MQSQATLIKMDIEHVSLFVSKSSDHILNSVSISGQHLYLKGTLRTRLGTLTLDSWNSSLYSRLDRFSLQILQEQTNEEAVFLVFWSCTGQSKDQQINFSESQISDQHGEKDRQCVLPEWSDMKGVLCHSMWTHLLGMPFSKMLQQTKPRIPYFNGFFWLWNPNIWWVREKLTSNKRTQRNCTLP